MLAVSARVAGTAATEPAPGSASATGPAGAPLLKRSWLLTPLLAAVIAFAFAVLPLDKAVVAAFTSGVLVVLSAIDIERRLIPNRIVLPAAAVVLVMQAVLFTGRVPEVALAAIIAAVVAILPALFGRAWMGMGDVKLVLLLGVALGWGVVGAVLFGFVCTLPVAVVVLIRGGLGARKAMLPFGPFLSIGALLVLFGPALAGLPTN